MAKTLSTLLAEVSGITHVALTKKVVKMFGDHANSSDNHETVHLKKNVHTGVTKHSTGSVKAHSLGYRHKSTLSDHPMVKQIQDLIKRHNGKSLGSKMSGDQGGFIDTSDGYRHHFSHTLGSNFNSLEHAIYKKQISESASKHEMSDEEIDAHNDSFNDKVVAAHEKYIHKIYGKKIGINFGSDHEENGDRGEFTSKVYHPKKGKIYVTTHYNTKTHEVYHHTEE